MHGSSWEGEIKEVVFQVDLGQVWMAAGGIRCWGDGGTECKERSLKLGGIWGEDVGT